MQEVVPKINDLKTGASRQRVWYCTSKIVGEKAQLDKATQMAYLRRDLTSQLITREVDFGEESEVADAGWYFSIQALRLQFKRCDARWMPLAAGDTGPTAERQGIVPRGKCFAIFGEVALEAEEGIQVFTGLTNE